MLFRRKRPSGGKTGPKVLRLPDVPAAIYAVGDIHGCLALYQDLEAAIARDAEGIDGIKLIVCLGDVIDRGAQSAQVLDHLLAEAPAGFQRMVLRGNHEDMFLRFLDNPGGNLAWLDYGGDETLRSYGLVPENDEGFAGDGRKLARKLLRSIPQVHKDFLSGLPCGLECGGLRFAHAGYELGLPAEKQSARRLMWGPPSGSTGGLEEAVLVHGHITVPEVEETRNRINLDLGAYQSGRLAAMRFRKIEKEIERKLLSVRKMAH